jgi:hypothetical protein
MRPALMAEILGHDAATVRNIYSDFYPIMIVTICTILFGLVIGLYSCYRLALVILGTIPFAVASSVLVNQGGC